MKKLLLITALIGTIGLAGYQMASARTANTGSQGWGSGYGYCGNFGGGGPGYGRTFGHNPGMGWGGGPGYGMGSGRPGGMMGYGGHMMGW